MDAERRDLGGSTSCSAVADVAAWGASQQQKRQRCQGSSSNDVVGTSTKKCLGNDSPSNSLQTSALEMQDFDYGENEEEDYNGENEEDYYDDDEEYDYEFDGDEFNQYLADKFDDLDLPPGVEATVPWLQKLAPSEGPSDFKSSACIEDEISKKFDSFKQFDTVQDFSDHHFVNKSVGKTGRDWSKRIQNDWKLLEKDLPASIYVRVYEDRMDLLRAVIIGPAGTPYHDGLFFFDVHFPGDYPNVPPMVYYHSGGLRLNPNLYACGKVCLSLLGTWSGQGCERWSKAHSTLLQVLLSIQALVLNEKPYFNEPGYELQANKPHGERSALEYNESTFLLSCKTMLYSLRRPPKHFEDLVAGHFRERGRTILSACKAYMEGLQIGSVIPDDKEDEDKEGSTSDAAKQDENKSDFNRHQMRTFKSNLEKLFEDLLMEFTVKGADTKKFLAEKVKKNEPAA